MNFLTAVNHLGDLMFIPEKVEPVERVGVVYSFSESTLAESARIIKENPELAKAMGVSMLIRFSPNTGER